MLRADESLARARVEGSSAPETAVCESDGRDEPATSESGESAEESETEESEEPEEPELVLVDSEGEASEGGELIPYIQEEELTAVPTSEPVNVSGSVGCEGSITTRTFVVGDGWSATLFWTFAPTGTQPLIVIRVDTDEIVRESEASCSGVEPLACGTGTHTITVSARNCAFSLTIRERNASSPRRQE